VLVMIEGTPPNTEVRRAGTLLGTAPGRVELPRSDSEVMLVLSADGYLPTTLAVVPTQNLKQTVTMKPRGGAVLPGPPPGGAGVRPAGGSAARPAGGGSAKPGGGSAARPPDEPTNDIEQFPPPTQPPQQPPPKK